MIAIKVSKLVANQLEPVTRNISCIGYYYNSKPKLRNACTNKAFSSKPTRFNPYFGWYKNMYAKHTSQSRD